MPSAYGQRFVAEIKFSSVLFRFDVQLLNVFLCCTVNIHFFMNIKYMLYIIATDTFYCD